jgi:hypothetical protein
MSRGLTLKFEKLWRCFIQILPISKVIQLGEKSASFASSENSVDLAAGAVLLFFSRAYFPPSYRKEQNVDWRVGFYTSVVNGFLRMALRCRNM